MSILGRVFFGLCTVVVGAAHAQQAESHTRRSAVIDCRAGCQNDRKGCQTSDTGEIRINAHPGKVFDTQTLRITKRWNASDSPGLSGDPSWNKTWMPRNSSHPTMVIISPVVSSCVERDPHTQGVTFYEWTVEYLE